MWLSPACKWCEQCCKSPSVCLSVCLRTVTHTILNVLCTFSCFIDWYCIKGNYILQQINLMHDIDISKEVKLSRTKAHIKNRKTRKQDTIKSHTLEMQPPFMWYFAPNEHVCSWRHNPSENPGKTPVIYRSHTGFTALSTQINPDKWAGETQWQQKAQENPGWYCNEGSALVWYFMGLCCLMTHGLSKDIECHVWPYYSLFINHQIRHQSTSKSGSCPGDLII